MSDAGRPCSICTHVRRVDVDAQLLAGSSLRDIAGQFACSKSSLSRHARSCIPALISAAAGVDEVVTANRLVSDLNQLRAVTLAVLDEARGDSDHGTALRAIARLESQVELIARLAGELIERRQVEEISIVVDAHWIALRGRIVSALKPHPVALMAVLAELADVERVL